jgi:poly [ADP-ribose] polymerase
MESKYLVMVTADDNHNKYYRMIPNGDNFEVQYGRIGVEGFQTATYPISQWNKKYNEKTKKGYVDKTELHIETITKSKKSEYSPILNKSISQIIERLQAMAKKAIEDNYTISSSKVTQLMIDEAQVEINKLLSAEDLDKFNYILIELFKIIPRKMSKVKEYLAVSKKDYAEIIQREQDLLDVMKGQVVEQSKSEIVESDEIVTKTETILDVMGLKFDNITSDDELLIKKQLGSLSNKFYQAWKVTNLKTQTKYDKFIIDEKITERKLLWHGSRNENWWSIINSGLLLRPSAVITGKMFGYGIYFAPKSEKSFGYTSYSGSYWAGGNSNTAFMSLFEVAYGKPYDVYSFDSKYYNFDYLKLQNACPTANCLHAHAGSMLRNDEIIVYKEEQLTQKYLVELR